MGGRTPPVDELDQMAAAKEQSVATPLADASRHRHVDATPTPYDDGTSPSDYLSAGSQSPTGLSTPPTPGLSRTSSSADVSGPFEFGQDTFPPVDRLTMFDILENLALPQRLEKMQNAIHDNAEKLRRQRARLASRALSSKNNLVGEWRKRVPAAPEEQLDKYRRRMRDSVDRLNKRWNDAKAVTMKEKISFVTAVLNIFISAYLIGAFPQYFHYWYTAQLAYFMPVRWYKYHKIGFHYFLADLCYFVNLLTILSIWFFPQSKRLLISTYCLAFGNNAVAIAMWRNSLVFHSLDKTTTLFIHIMPCATLHVLVHLIPKSMQLQRFPAIYTIKYSSPGAPEHYTLWDMIIWATLPYAIWQLSYHFLITVRKRSKIEAGRPTSFTWLRRSYRENFLGKFVLSFPEAMQESVFMGIQYSYALLTMLPCPLWFWYRWASAGFLMIVFTWASWNGATYYIDVFGRRMEKELEQLRKEVARMAKSPEISGQDGTAGFASPIGSPSGPHAQDGVAKTTALDLGPAADLTSFSHRRDKSESDASFMDDATEPAKSGTSLAFTPGFEMLSNGTAKPNGSPIDPNVAILFFAQTPLSHETWTAIAGLCESTLKKHDPTLNPSFLREQILDNGTGRGEGRVYEILASFSGKPWTLDNAKSLDNNPELEKVKSEKQLEIACLPFKLHVLHQKPGLAVFDMDSTLIQQEVIDELARTVGLYNQVASITEAAMRGELDFEESLRARVKLLKGVKTSIWEELKAHKISFTPGALDLIKSLKHLGWKTAVLSGGFTPLANWVKDTLGLDYAFANHLVEDEDAKELTGELLKGAPIIHAKKKEALLLQLAAENQIPLQQVIAVGDGSNDLLMMHAAGLGIAFNAKPKVQQAAPVKLNSDTLLDVMYMLGYNKSEINDALAGHGRSNGTT